MLPPSAARGGHHVPTPSARTLKRADGTNPGKKSVIGDVDCLNPRDAQLRNLLPPLNVDLEMEAIMYDGNT